MRLVAISDTHGYHRELSIPDGDLLVHAGDLTRYGRLEDVSDFNSWLGELPHRHKVIIAGNHDFCFEEQPEASRALITEGVYLEDSWLTIDSQTVYGSPWQPWFFDWAFNLRRGPEIRAKWEMIPSNVNILITHGPPMGICDLSLGGEHVGCADLLAVTKRVGPDLHIFGHIHEGAGVFSNGLTTYINASNCGFPDCLPLRSAVVYDL